MNLRRRFFYSVMCLALLGATREASASPILDFTGGTPTRPGGDTIAGWEFRVTSTIAIDGLGLWDEGANGLNHTHDVGLWNSDGSVLLASTTISSGSTPVASTSTSGRWLFNTIGTLVLNPGTYVVGATFLNADPDSARLQASQATISQVTFVQARQRRVTSTLAFPDVLSPDLNDGIFGPNVRTADAAPVPEPSTLILLASALAGLNAARSRRRNQASGNHQKTATAPDSPDSMVPPQRRIATSRA